MMLTRNNNVVNGPIQALKEKLPGSMIKKYNDYKCSAPFRGCQCHCCCYPAYQSSWLIIPLWWHQFYGLWNASQCFHNAIQLGHSIHHWAAESLLIGWRADCHSPAEEGYGFWRSDSLKKKNKIKHWACVEIVIKTHADNPTPLWPKHLIRMKESVCFMASGLIWCSVQNVFGLRCFLLKRWVSWVAAPMGAQHKGRNISKFTFCTLKRERCK